MTKDRLTSPLPTNQGQSDPLISPQEKRNIHFDSQKNGVHMSVENPEETFSLEENQGSSRKMGARKDGKSTKMCCFNPKEYKDEVKNEYQAASFREMVTLP